MMQTFKKFQDRPITGFIGLAAILLVSASVVPTAAVADQPSMSKSEAKQYVKDAVRDIYRTYGGRPTVSEADCDRRSRTAFRCKVTYNFRRTQTRGTMNLSYHDRPTVVSYDLRGRNRSTVQDLGSIPVHFRGRIPR